MTGPTQVGVDTAALADYRVGMTPTTETTCGHWRVGVPGHVVCGKPVPEGSRYCLDCTRADERRAASPVSATSG